MLFIDNEYNKSSKLSHFETNFQQELPKLFNKHQEITMNYPLILIGIFIVCFFVVINHVHKPWKWRVELSLPFSISEGVAKRIANFFHHSGEESDNVDSGKSRRAVFIEWDAGFHFLWLRLIGIMHVVGKYYCADKKIEVTMGVADEHPGHSDPVEFTDAEAGVRFQVIIKVIDTFAAHYAIDEYEEATLNRIEAKFRRLLAELSLDKAMTDISVIEKAAQQTFEACQNDVQGWGVEITSPDNELAFISFILSTEITDARAKLLLSQKDADAIVIEAKGNAKAKVILAESEKTATALTMLGIGQGEVNKIKHIGDELGLDVEQVMAYLLTGEYFKSIAEAENATVISTSDGGHLNAPIQTGAITAGLFSAMQSSQNQNQSNTNVGDKS